MKFGFNWLIACLALVCLATGGAQAEVPSSPSTPGLSEHGQLLWEKYLQTLPWERLQEDCKPRIIPARGPYRGVATLLHGYTACPQQFFSLADKLSAEGFTVILPLAPGHGLRWTMKDGKKIDDNSGFPTALPTDDRGFGKVYAPFVGDMNQLAASFPGERVLGGISVGATIALHMANAAPDIWNRQIIMSPLLDATSNPLRQTLDAIMSTGWNPLLGALLNTDIGWGQGCEDERSLSYVQTYGREQTRAGICQFKATHAMAVGRYGIETGKSLHPTPVQTQFLAVTEDIIVNHAGLFKAVERLQGITPDLFSADTVGGDRYPTAKICYLPSSNTICANNLKLPLDQQQKPCINHSMLSRFDAPNQNKYWIAPLEEKLVDFIAHGEFFAIDEQAMFKKAAMCAGFPR